MNERHAFLFPGHGTHFPGMGIDLTSRLSTFRETVDSCISSNSALTQTADFLFSADHGSTDELNAQAAIFLVNAGYERYLKEHSVIPAVCYGYSSGIYSAFVAAGAISLEDGLRCVQWAWECMSPQPMDAETGMIVVTGLTHSVIADILREKSQSLTVSIANINSDRQVFLSGTKRGLTELMPDLRRPGLLNIQWLPVSVPYHSPLLADAAARFAKRIGDMRISDAFFPVLDGSRGLLVSTAGELRELLGRQLVAPVNLPLCADRLVSLGITHCWETGAGSFLQRLLRYNRLLPLVRSATDFL